MTTSPNKIRDELIDKTDVGIILSDYLANRWSVKMRDDIVDMVNSKFTSKLQAYTDEIRSEVIGVNEWAVKCICGAPVSKMCVCTNEGRNNLKTEQRQALDNIATKWGAK